MALMTWVPWKVSLAVAVVAALVLSAVLLSGALGPLAGPGAAVALAAVGFGGAWYVERAGERDLAR